MKDFLKKLRYVVTSVVLIVGFMFCIGYIVYYVEAEVKKVGLKNLVADIWEGESESE